MSAHERSDSGNKHGEGGAQLATEDAVIVASQVEFDEIKRHEEASNQGLNLDFIMDIPLTLRVELGRRKMHVNELLRLGQGSVIELTKLAGKPMDVFVSDRLIARGEVVVVNEKFGVRLTDVVSLTERITNLK